MRPQTASEWILLDRERHTVGDLVRVVCPRGEAQLADLEVERKVLHLDRAGRCTMTEKLSLFSDGRLDAQSI